MQENKNKLKRNLGEGYSPAGITEELFDAQRKVNKYEMIGKEIKKKYLNP